MNLALPAPPPPLAPKTDLHYASDYQCWHWVPVIRLANCIKSAIHNVFIRPPVRRFANCIAHRAKRVLIIGDSIGRELFLDWVEWLGLDKVRIRYVRFVMEV